MSSRCGIGDVLGAMQTGPGMMAGGSKRRLNRHSNCAGKRCAYFGRYEIIGIRYEDAGAMGAVVADVEAMLRAHDGIDADNFLMVNFNAFAPSSLDFFIYCYTRTRKWAEYHQVKQDVLLRIIEIIDRHGAEIAFPTSTVHIARGVPVADGSATPGASAGEEQPPDAR